MVTDMATSQEPFNIPRKPVATATTTTVLNANQAGEVSVRSSRSLSSVSALSDDVEAAEAHHGEAVVIVEPEFTPATVHTLQNEKPSSKKVKRKGIIKRIVHFAGPWTLEFWSMVLAWLAFAAIVAVLTYYNQKPQGQWPYRSLTLNGLLALLASISRASLMVGVAAAIGQGKWNWFVDRSKGGRTWKRRKLGDFEAYDDASRGAWGSLVLLWKRCGLLASVGAIITILLLGFDTFAQQIIAIDGKDVDAGDQEQMFMPRSEYYDHRHFLTFNRDFTAVGDLSIKSAVYNGIVNQNLTEISIVCPTGNCTWPIIPTVAVCGSCVDMTPNITKSCNSEYCNHTTPNGLSLDGRITQVQLSDIDAKRNFFQLWTRFEPYTRLWSNKIPETPSYLAIFQSIGAPYPAQDLRIVNAAECALYLCLQAHNVTTIRGKTTSNIVSNHTSATASSAFDYNFTNVPLEEFDISTSQQYGSSKASLQAISDSLSSYTYGTVDAYQLAGVGSSSWEYNVSSDTIQAFWQASTSIYTFDAFVQNIAKSVSNTIRLTSPATTDSDRYRGTATTQRPFIRIRWAWITYPAFMIVASPVFLLITVIQTRKKKVCVWKSSITPVLFTTVDHRCENLHLLASENSVNAGKLADAVSGVEVMVRQGQTLRFEDRSSGFWTLDSDYQR